MHIQITYVCMKKPGVAEAEFATNDLKYEFKKIFVMHKPASLIIAKDKVFFNSIDSNGSCPPCCEKKMFPTTWINLRRQVLQGH
jgi:hypothetical protein